MPYSYAPFKRQGDISLNNYNYIYGFPFFSNQSTLWAGLEAPIYSQEDILLNKINYFNLYSYANPTIPGWSSPFLGQPIQMPSCGPPFYQKGNSVLNNFYYYFNYPNYSPKILGLLYPWPYFLSSLSDSEDQKPEPRTREPLPRKNFVPMCLCPFVPALSLSFLYRWCTKKLS